MIYYVLLIWIILFILRAILCFPDYWYVKKVIKEYDFAVMLLKQGKREELNEIYESWFIEQRYKLEGLMKKANISDGIIPMVKSVGYGHLVQYNLPSMLNFGNFHDIEVIYLNLDILHNLKGFYKQKFKENFSLNFWVRFFIMLPQKLLEYVAPGTTNKLSHVLNVVYWIWLIYVSLKGFNNQSDIANLNNFIKQMVNFINKLT